MVTVLVAKEEKRFTLHQDAVCAKSKFFKAACSKHWLEGQKRTVRLPEVEVATFQSYCRWIYADDLLTSTCAAASSKSEKHAEQTSFIKLYLLGDTLDDVELRTKATSRLFAVMRSHDLIPSVPNLNLIYEATPSGSLLRKMVVDVFVARVDRGLFKMYAGSSPADFGKEVTAAALEAAPKSTWEAMAENLPEYTGTKKSA
jgi:hypothetical protein